MAILIPGGLGITALFVILAATTPGKSPVFYAGLGAFAAVFFLITVLAPLQLRYPGLILGGDGMWFGRPTLRIGEPRWDCVTWEEIEVLEVFTTNAGPFLRLWTRGNPRPPVASKRFWTARPRAQAYLSFLTIRREVLFQEIEARAAAKGVDLGQRFRR
jgi:hypothetical protein